jgi:beta-galactosidase
MNRRSRGLVAGILGAVTTALLPAPGGAAAPASALPAVRESALEVVEAGGRSVDLTKDWKFALVNPAGITDPTGEYANAQEPGFDDSSWRTLDVPHDWSIELLPTTGPGTGTSSGTGFLQGGLGWYRKTFTLPPTMADKKLSIEFDGVYMDSYVYVNGQLVGNHPYGYTGFAFDITDLVYTDATTPNVIAVKVQNQQPSSRWYSGSGIYRNVRLTVTNPIHVARWGTFVSTPDLESTIQSGFATVHAQTDVVNQTETPTDVEAVSTVVDANGNKVATAATSSSIPPGTHRDAVDIRLDDPTLWSFDNPYLYTLRTDVVVGGEVVDTYATRFGVRYFEINPDGGFVLNGVYAKIQGVDLHHDLGALGAAVNRDALMRQMTIMKSMGVNALRTAHNPPAPELIDVCQELGIVMMVEAFDTWSSRKVTFDYARFFNEWADSDIKEMVNTAKNSPAVIMWSIGNEIRGQTVATAQRLIDDVRSIDTTRPIVWGHDGYRSVPSDGSTNDQIARLLDGVGLNYNTAQSVDALHAKYPDKFWFESESSSSTSTRGYYQDPHQLNTGENYTPGKRAASSYDNNMASWTMPGEYGLKKDRDRKYFTGEFLWSGFDYIGEPTPFNVFPVKSSHFGAVDTAGFPKDLYYAFKSQWTTEPMVHLVPMNWTDYKPGDDVEVWAYANVDTVELFLNGESLGVRRYDHKTTTYGKEYLETTEPTGDDKTFPSGSYTSPNGSTGKLHLTWHVPFEPGRLVAVAKRDGVEVARDELRTAGAPYTLRLTPDKKVVKADGKSLSFVTVEVVDANGTIVPNAENAIALSVEGSGKLVGVDSGREESAEGYKTASRNAFHGKALAIVSSAHDAGPITFKATSPGLLPVTTTLYSVNDTASHELVALEPVHLRAALGTEPALPGTVEAVYADGSQQPVEVHWADLPSRLYERTGVYSIEGRVRGIELRARALITVFTVGGIETYSTVVPVGTAPGLPATLRLVYNDGVERMMPVQWEPVDPATYAVPGLFTVHGVVEGTALPAVASVRVTDEVTEDQNIARATSPLHPSADASYSGAGNTLPAAMLDGTMTAGGWSNAYNKAATALLPSFSIARDGDWASVAWPNPQTFAEMTAYFTMSSTRAQPASVEVTYWNGTTFVPVSDLGIAWAAGSNEPTSLTFDPVTTTQIKLSMTSKLPRTTAGHIQIAELQVMGDVVAYNTTAALTDLRVNGETILGFDPETTAYTLEVGQIPDITATAADNGRLLIAPPLAIPGTATITVTSEEGLAKRTYSIDLVYDFTGFFPPVAAPPRPNTVSAGGTVPVKFSLNGDQGLDVLALGSPTSQQIDCETAQPQGEPETTSSPSGLRYDAYADQYIYTWATDESWAGTCRQLTVTLKDGSTHIANFRFR